MNEAKQGLALVSIRLEGSKLGTTSTLDGSYRLDLPRSLDSVVLLFTKPGYQPLRRVLHQVRTAQRMNVVLRESSSDLEEVQVQGHLPYSAHKTPIDSTALHSALGPSGSVEALVGTLAGVSQRDELSSQYSVRGGSFEENLVYVNGIELQRPLLSRRAEQEGLSAIHPELVQSVYFSAGGFPVSYGDKSSSVLDISYRRPQAPEGSLLLGLQQSRLHLGGTLGRLSYLLGLRYRQTSSLLQRSDTHGEYRPRHGDAQILLTYDLSAALQLQLGGYLRGVDYRFSPRDRLTSFGTLAQAKQLKVYFDGAEDDRFRNYLTSASLRYRPNNHQSHRLTLAWHEASEAIRYAIQGEYLLADLLPDSPTPQASDTPTPIVRHSSQANSTGTLRLFASTWGSTLYLNKLRIRLGAEMKSMRSLTSIYEHEQLEESTFPGPTDGAINVRSRHTREGKLPLQAWYLATYAEGRFSLSPNLALTAGLRYSWWGGNEQGYLSPRLELYYRPTRSALALYLTTGLYYQSPTPQELQHVRLSLPGYTQLTLNQELRTQRSAVLLAGSAYQLRFLGRPFLLTGEAFYKRLSHVNPYSAEHVQLHFLGESTASARIYGIDGRLYGEFVPGMNSWLSLSLLQTQVRYATGLTSPLPNAPACTLSLLYQDYLPGFPRLRMTLRGVYASGLPVFFPKQIEQAPAFTSPAYQRVDLGVTFRAYQRPTVSQSTWMNAWGLRSVDLGLEVFNLFDIQNASSYYWLATPEGAQYAVPNYLTGRLWNVFLKVQL